MKNNKLNKLFYPKLALDNIRKNGTFYYPYLITCIFTIAMFYIMCFIVYNPGLSKISGGDSLKAIIAFGCGVVGIFSFIFLVYANSFLMKRRKKEFGMYNILGMEKRHIGRIMVLESIYTTIGTLIAGIVCGVVFSKLVLMLLDKMLKFDARVKFIFSLRGALLTAVIFAVIFVIILMGNLLSIARSKPIELLHGTSVGEKEPKTKIILAILGAATLFAGYYIAITTESPLDALEMFFIAVVLVIIGTYSLFTAGSIAILKMLRKNKAYYYRTNHFTAVSGMLYRMKKNAAGLASICILSTMVLVVVSTTVSMYVGTEDALKYRFPYHVVTEKEYMYSEQNNMEEGKKLLRDTVKKDIAKYEMSEKDFKECMEFAVMTSKSGDSYKYEENFYSTKAINIFDIVTAEDYEKMSGQHFDLQKDEIVEYSDGKELEDEFTLGNLTFKVKDRVEDFDIGSDYTGYMAEIHMIVVSDMEVMKNIFNDRCDVLGINETNEADSTNNIRYIIRINFNDSDEKITKFFKGMDKDLEDIETYSECRPEVRNEFYALYGGLLFVGIFLGLLFLIITVLIIYYKQITEGYEDKQRFEIMQKVGMSRSEVKKSIRSQILTVFMLPIIVAAAHVVGSFAMITKLLALMNLTNESLFRTCTLCTIGIFIVVYCLVYYLTSKIYYNIVES